MAEHKKRTCEVNRVYFRLNAKPVTVVLYDEDGKELGREVMQPKEFSTGSMGWNGTGKVRVPIGPIDRPWAQMGLNLTLVGSKELPPLTDAEWAKAKAAALAELEAAKKPAPTAPAAPSEPAKPAGKAK